MPIATGAVAIASCQLPIASEVASLVGVASGGVAVLLYAVVAVGGVAAGGVAAA